MARPRAPFTLPAYDFRAVNGADIVRRIRLADGVEEAPAYYGVHGLDRAQEEAEAVGLKSLWYHGRVWTRVVAAGGELVWLTDASGQTASGYARVPLQPSLLGGF